MKRYLAPTDFSSGCDYALSHAKEQAKQNNAELHIVHVIQPTAYPVGMEMGHAPISDLQEQMRESSAKKLSKIKSNLDSEGYSCKTEILNGKPSTEIINYANDNDIDLIFINTHGAGGLEHLLFGSTTEKVLRKAECPVYVVRNKI